MGFTEPKLNPLRAGFHATGLILLLGLHAARSAAADDGGVTMLEPVFVEASTGDPWNYFTVPGFEVISHCSDSFNTTYARALERATAARLAVLPAEFWGDLPTPMKVILYNREPKRRDSLGRGNVPSGPELGFRGRQRRRGVRLHRRAFLPGDGR